MSMKQCFDDFCDERLQGACIAYWAPFIDKPFCVCAIRLRDGMVFSGDTSADPDLCLEQVSILDLQERARAAAFDRLNQYCIAAFHDDVVNEPESEPDPDILLDDEGAL